MVSSGNNYRHDSDLVQYPAHPCRSDVRRRGRRLPAQLRSGSPAGV